MPALSLAADASPERMTSRELLAAIDQAQRVAEHSGVVADYRKHQHKAFSLLTASKTKSAFDVRAEPQAVRDKYGPGINSTSMLLARRLVEAGVPFVTVFWKGDKELDTLCKSGGGWDTHGNNFNCLKDRLLPEFDRPFAASRRFARARPAGRDAGHRLERDGARSRRWAIHARGARRRGATIGRTACPCCWLVAASAAGRFSVRVTSWPNFRADRRHEHIAHTVFHSLGIDDLMAQDREGRPFHLMDSGRPLTELF